MSVRIVAVLMVSLVAGGAGADSSGDLFLQGGGPAGSWVRSGEREISTAEEARLLAVSAAYLRRVGLSGMPVLGEFAAPYVIHPQAGNLNGDLWPNGFVDLDPGAGILDFDCSGLTYDTHRGIDTDLRTFTEQQIGVPVLAALDGTVVDVHDGEPDMNQACVEPSNYVILHHGGTHFTWYLHLKQGSVAVAVDDVVPAGTQLGATASSGCSFWPHLHFESRLGAGWFEPYSGPCRPGPSQWLRQEPLREDTFLTDFVLTADDLTQWQGAPFDTSRTGHLVLGTVPHFWVQLKNLPANATWRTRFRRPGGAIALDESGNFGGNPYFRSSVWWQRWFINLNEVGTWTLIYGVGGVTLVEAPFEVVASPAQITNRPPHAVAAVFDPQAPRQGEVLFCRVATSLTLDDPDYDVVRYRYRWRVDGALIRDVTHAGQADALPRTALTAGREVRCTVTPSDGEADGPNAETVAIVASPCTGPPESCFFADGFESGGIALWTTMEP